MVEEPSAQPIGEGAWVEVAVDEAWVDRVAEIEALPDGGYVAVLASDDEDASSQQAALRTTVMWSPDGVEWFDGDPEHQVLLTSAVVVVGGQVIAVDEVDLSTGVPLAVGDPRMGVWDRLLLEPSGSEDGLGHSATEVALAANDEQVLVVHSIAGDEGGTQIVVWVVEVATGNSTTDSFTIPSSLELADPAGVSQIEWVDGRWVLLTLEGVPGPLNEPAQRYVLRTSDDGVVWLQSDLPQGMCGGVSLESGPLGLVATICTMGPAECWPSGLDAAWYSDDGLDWTRVPGLGGHVNPIAGSVGDYGFVLKGDESGLTLVAEDGSGSYEMDAPFGGTESAASSGDTLLIQSEEGLWLYSTP